jgi:hypothetical protein
MMRIAYRLPLLTFVLLSLAAAGGGPRVSVGQSGIPTVDYCDLIRNPALYDGKEIRLRGVYTVSGKSDSSFFSSSCGSGTSLWVDFGPTYQSCTKPALVKRLAEMVRKSGWRWGRPHVTVIVVVYRRAAVEFVGTFRAANPYKRPDAESNRPQPPADSFIEPKERRESYDFVFSVSCAEKVKPLPKGAKY